MEFRGKVQAFIAARYYVRLTEAFGERGKRAFIHCTQNYTEQRGHRMAQRAIRDGKELTADVFEQYRELIANHTIDIEGLSPNFVMHVRHCEWRDQFEEMGLDEAGREYCRHLDISLCRGFNPYIDYRVNHTFCDGDCCVHTIKDANFTKDTDFTVKPEHSRSIEYHCGNVYWLFNQIIAAIFGSGGEQVNALVLSDFVQEYGQEMADTLVSYRHVNFSLCTSY